MIKKICEKCFEEFTCTGNDGHCWCFELPYVRLDETDEYKNCLCKKCLVKIIDEKCKNNNQG